MRTLLRSLLTERNWQYPAFRSHFEQAAKELAGIEGHPPLGMLSVSESTFERWCSGKVRPQPDARRVLQHLFGYSAEELMVETRVSSGSDIVSPCGGSAGGRVPGDAAHQEMGRLASMAANRALQWAMTAESNRIGSETMDHVQSVVRAIAEQYPRVPLSTILDDLIDIQDLTFRLLESGRAKPAQARDLHLYAAIASGMLAKASHDLGDPQSAMRQARAAYVCADQADHAAMRGWVRGLQSLIAYWAGRPQDARHYAESGASLAPDAGTVGLWLASLRARALAVLGEAEAVMTAIQHSADAREAVTTDALDEMGGILTFPNERQLYYMAEAEVLLPGSTPTAERRTEAAVAAYRAAAPQNWAFGDEAGARTNLALARIQAGNPDGAAEALDPVLNLAANQRIAGILASALRVHRALGAPAYATAASARDLRARIETLASTPARALPR
ncbi:hypothetical protein RM780_02690 [Streptomyces sp. DSM 44917]|uniref:XRE family transcriptional regulator n=1 Tax=Streptomyces boetiae TaxID=3075541 RepID=A0ABU2L2T2_9ACTN|nr:hypothetical protein [Streptomyces sp. DSM 44917]MDT0305870.1 hypothetical protein [Streptomyces sp. DSM 44917]